jgi:hypothetical protein
MIENNKPSTAHFQNVNDQVLEQILVEVFKTNVHDKQIAIEIITSLKRLFPNYRINFDLDDCDRILRIEPESGYVEADQVINVVRSLNYDIEALQ